MSGEFYFTAEQVELAWAAGFFDGEGCTIAALPEHSAMHQLNITIPQCGSREELDRFVQAVGRGTVYGPYRHPSMPENWSEKYMFRVTGTKAFAVLWAVWPWLSTPKKDQALSALSCITRMGYKGRPKL